MHGKLSLALVVLLSFLLAVDILHFQDSPVLSEGQQQWRQQGGYFSFKFAEGQSHAVFFIAEPSHSETEPSNVLLVIHGFPTSSYDYSKIWSNLTSAERVPGEELFGRVITFDLLGFGFSDKPLHHSYSIHEQADIAQALLASQGITENVRVHILCHDYGVLVGTELLSRFIENQRSGQNGITVASICFLNGGLFPETRRNLLVQTLLQWPVIGPIVAKLTNYDMFSYSLRKIFSVPPTEEEMKEYWASLRFNEGDRLGHKLIHYIADCTRHRERWVAALQANAVPQIVINGPDDPVSGSHMVARYRELVPNPQTLSLGAGVGHFPQIEAPTQTVTAYLDFVKKSL